MSGRFVRASQYRHVFGTAAKPEHEYQETKAQCLGDGNFIAASDKFFAYATQGGGGPVVVHPLNKPCRLPHSVPTLAVHKDAVLDFDFSPFAGNVLATGSEDCTIKVSVIPDEGLTSNLTEYAASLEGHGRKVTSLHWHPTASNILASVSADCSLRVWDIEKQSQALVNNDFGDVVHSFDWNPDGSLIASSCKDLHLRVFDPRDPVKEAVKTSSFTGTKASRVVWQGDKGRIIAVGSSKQSARQYGVWDIKMPNNPLTMVDIDTSAGVLMPFYDAGNSILYLAGKGDASIRYYEVVDQDPYVHFLSEYRDSESTKGMCWLPKRKCDVNRCEIAVALRLLRDRVCPISFQVPRKSDQFQADLFPDTNAGVPSNTASEYLAGTDAAPVKMSLKPGANNPQAQAAAATLTVKKSYAQLEKELEDANKKIAELEAELKQLKGQN